MFWKGLFFGLYYLRFISQLFCFFFSLKLRYSFETHLEGSQEFEERSSYVMQVSFSIPFSVFFFFFCWGVYKNKNWRIFCFILSKDKSHILELCFLLFVDVCLYLCNFLFVLIICFPLYFFMLCLQCYFFLLIVTIYLYSDIRNWCCASNVIFFLIVTYIYILI